MTAPAKAAPPPSPAGTAPLASERVRLAEAALAFDRRCAELADADLDDAIARLRAALDTSLDRVHEAARAVGG